MKKLNFVFKNDDNVIYDEVVDYELINEYICFTWDKFDYKFRFDDDVEFIRSGEDVEFILEGRGNDAKCKVILKDQGVDVCVDVIHFEYKKEDHEYTIIYSVESDRESLKKIILTLCPITY